MRAEAEHQGADVDISVLEQQAIRDIMGSRTDHLTGVGCLVPQGARMAAEVVEVYGSEAGMFGARIYLAGCVDIDPRRVRRGNTESGARPQP